MPSLLLKMEAEAWGQSQLGKLATVQGFARHVFRTFVCGLVRLLSNINCDPLTTQQFQDPAPSYCNYFRN